MIKFTNVRAAAVGRILDIKYNIISVSGSRGSFSVIMRRYSHNNSKTKHWWRMIRLYSASMVLSIRCANPIILYVLLFLILFGLQYVCVKLYNDMMCEQPIAGHVVLSELSSTQCLDLYTSGRDLMHDASEIVRSVEREADVNKIYAKLWEAAHKAYMAYSKILPVDAFLEKHPELRNVQLMEIKSQASGYENSILSSNKQIEHHMPLITGGNSIKELWSRFLFDAAFDLEMDAICDLCYKSIEQWPFSVQLEAGISERVSNWNDGLVSKGGVPHFSYLPELAAKVSKVNQLLEHIGIEVRVKLNSK